MLLLIIYRALYGKHELWCRPYEMFLEALDPAKYPEVVQKDRFELQTDSPFANVLTTAAE